MSGATIVYNRLRERVEGVLPQAESEALSCAEIAARLSEATDHTTIGRINDACQTLRRHKAARFKDVPRRGGAPIRHWWGVP